MITIKYKLVFFLFFAFVVAFAQQKMTGVIIDQTSLLPIAKINVTVQNTEQSANTDQQGKFSIEIPSSNAVLKISGVGYEQLNYNVIYPVSETVIIKIIPKTIEIEEITLSTGYQKIAKERATGSFSKVGSEALNKQITTNILDKLPALANGVVFENGTSDTPQLMVRGLSTMRGPRSPLIILDDFPYEGNINNINPNTIESVTILKDAAASSIWGARAANGVIVLTTKKAMKNQALSLEFTANTGFSSKPDLGYIKQMSSSDFIDVEKELFNQGFYNSDIASPLHPVITPVVDILDKEKNGIISTAQAQSLLENLKQKDVRDQYSRYMYQNAQNMQYALNLSGSQPKISWIAGVGYDDNSGTGAQKFQRLNLRLNNTWKPFEKLEISAGILYNSIREKSGKLGYGDVRMSGNWQIPYLQFADNDGNPLTVFNGINQNYKDGLANSGLLDWNYVPLNDWKHAYTQSTNNEMILNGSVLYEIIKGLQVDVKYQYQQANGSSQNSFDENSYYARNYINSFAQIDTAGNVKFIVPKGGILDNLNSTAKTNNIRAQLNVNNAWQRHSISAIAGAEARSSSMGYEQNRYYGYNDHTKSSVPVNYTQQFPLLVSGANDFIQNGHSMREKNVRFVSLFANAAYTFDKKYTVSGSIRRDASNLFGLKTNDQWNPFWSAGLAWKVSDEKFYPIKWLPNLKIRGSYGFNGNIDPSMVAVTTILYDTTPSIYTGTGMARIDNFYNPNLRWETTRTINGAIDFATQNNRVSGSLEFYAKKGTNLFGTAPLDYTTGITTLLWNAAGMKGKGMDIELKSRNIISKTWNWNSIINFSTYKDEVTEYFLPNTFASNYVSVSGVSSPISGVIGSPVFSVYAYKWAGLDPLTGEAQGYLDGVVSKDYTAITGSDKGIEDLQFFGSAIPTKWGSFINSFSYKNLGMDIGITYKMGYWFRRQSINYTDLMVSRLGHSDFASRWQKPGDELTTDVPSFNYTSDSARDAFYNGSSVLVEKGDHVRLQYINLSYNFNVENWKNKIFKSLQMYGAVNNLGIIWKANKKGIDPDYSWGYNTLKPVQYYTIGLQAKF